MCVFAVCRALGIPARPVTGYNVAHDSDGNLMLEIYYDENGKRLEGVDTTWYALLTMSTY